MADLGLKCKQADSGSPLAAERQGQLMCFDPLVRDELTVSLALPRRARREAGRTSCPISDPLTSSPHSYSYKESQTPGPQMPCLGFMMSQTTVRLRSICGFTSTVLFFAFHLSHGFNVSISILCIYHLNYLFSAHLFPYQTGSCSVYLKCFLAVILIMTT